MPRPFRYRSQFGFREWVPRAFTVYTHRSRSRRSPPHLWQSIVTSLSHLGLALGWFHARSVLLE